MKTLMKRMAVMSVALVLLCVCAVAQNEKSTKSVTEGNYGVVVTPSYVLLAPGAEETVTVIVELGYEDPVVIYQGNSYDDNNDIIIGDSFIATIKNSTSGGCQIEITAKNVNEIDSDILYVIATEIYNSDEINRSSTQLYGFPLIITVDPTLKKK